MCCDEGISRDHAVWQAHEVGAVGVPILQGRMRQVQRSSPEFTHSDPEPTLQATWVRPLGEPGGA